MQHGATMCGSVLVAVLVLLLGSMLFGRVAINFFRFLLESSMVLILM